MPSARLSDARSNAARGEGQQNMSQERIIWLGHSSFKILADKTIYIDPWKLRKPDPADIILVSHPHFDHFSVSDINKLLHPETRVIAPRECGPKLSGNFRLVSPGDTVVAHGYAIDVFPAYNIEKTFHPRKNGWVGYIINIGKRRIYYAGDTDCIPEMKALGPIDVALLPIGGTYTMNPKEAAEAANSIRAQVTIPYHYGDIIGSAADAEQFAKCCKVKTILFHVES
jgi:L-ascorbate metabolism protein UlaG (beta-lactamase superfamily)